MFFSSKKKALENKGVKKLRHGTVSSNGAISFNVSEIKASFNEKDQQKTKDFFEAVSIKS
tara:strand:- start:2251 stop:2430 length:180 start_codon:yes stop_codon:yes gene_type:complete